MNIQYLGSDCQQEEADEEADEKQTQEPAVCSYDSQSHSQRVVANFLCPFRDEGLYRKLYDIVCMCVCVCVTYLCACACV